MPARASWTGQLKLSLITIPVRLHNAVSSTTRISLNQLHKDCHQRLRQNLVCPKHGTVERSDIVKGYEYEKGRYVVVEETDLEHIRLETTKCIELVQFIPGRELDPIYWDSPYYLAPDGPVAQEAFDVIREAMKQTGKIGIGRVVMAGREHIVALMVQDPGFLLVTLRSAAEVRGAGAYFEDIQEGPVCPEQLALAERLIESRTGALDTAQFTPPEAGYQEALLDLIKAKLQGPAPVAVQQREVGQVLNFMEALKQSVVEGEKKPAAKSIKPATRKKVRSA